MKMTTMIATLFCLAQGMFAASATAQTPVETLGVKSLRVGGSSVDTASDGIPAEPDIDSLFEFAKAAGVKVIYSVRLKNGDADSAAKIARHIMDHYADELDSFAIGNEPGSFGHGYNYDAYRPQWKKIMAAMVAAAPGARFSGPDENPNPKWMKRFVSDFSASCHLTALTGHLYAGGCSYKNPMADQSKRIPNNPVAAREKLLSPGFSKAYDSLLRDLRDATAGTTIPYRLSETNSLWAGGLHGASDSFASALWGVDYLCWWAAHGSDGVNFHTGDKVGGGKTAGYARYGAFLAADKGYDVHPLGYGMKLFNFAAAGRVAPVKRIDTSKANVTAYLTVDNDTAFVTIVNKEHDADGKSEQIIIDITSSAATAADVMLLKVPGDDIAASTGLTLGGDTIKPDGSWNGKWTSIAVADPKKIAYELPSATAAVVRIRFSSAPIN
jgi:hypothetical protein